MEWQETYLVWVVCLEEDAVEKDDRVRLLPVDAGVEH